MKKLISIFNFHIKSSLHLSLCVLSLIIITNLRFDLDFNYGLFVCIFCATVVVYNFIKYASTLPYYFFTKNTPVKKIQILSFISGFFLVISVFFLKTNTILIGFILFVLCLTYVVPLNRTSINIRNYSKVKIFIVAFCWAGATILMPFAENTRIDLWDNVWQFLQRFIFVFVYTLPFEIRDLEYDSIKLKTIPQVIGINKTKILAYLLLIIFCVIGFFIDSEGSKFFLSDIIIAFTTAVLISKTKLDQSKYYTSFLVEGLPIFWLIVILIVENII